MAGQLPEVVRDAVSSPGVRLAVGISDGLPKLVVRRLMQSILHEPNLRLLCHEDEFQDLLGNLSWCIGWTCCSDASVPPIPTSRSTATCWPHPRSVGTRRRLCWRRHARISPGRWQACRCCCRRPTSQCGFTSIYGFAAEFGQAKIAGEFEDSALLKTFGAGGMGVFAAPDMVHEELAAQYHVKRIAPCEVSRRNFS